jgi:hypothetical protein
MTDTEEGRRFLQQIRNDGNDEAADLINTLARQLADARDHAARLDHDLDVVMSERDAAQDALQETHIALGGDGEWVAKIPEEEPPHSGDLHADVPALAAELFAAKSEAEARLAEARAEITRLDAQLGAAPCRGVNAEGKPRCLALAEAKADAASWEQQASDRVKDWHEMKERAEKAEARLADAERYVWLVETDNVPDEVIYGFFMQDKALTDAAIDAVKERGGG